MEIKKFIENYREALYRIHRYARARADVRISKGTI